MAMAEIVRMTIAIGHRSLTADSGNHSHRQKNKRRRSLRKAKPKQESIEGRSFIKLKNMRINNPCIYLMNRLGPVRLNVRNQSKQPTSNHDTVNYCAKIVR